MAPEHDTSDVDRWQVIKVMYAEGMTFPQMLPELQALGLLTCKNDHRIRVNRDGSKVCASCEMTVSQQWRRGLARLTETEADVLEVKGAWIEAHEFIRDTCRRNAVVTFRSTVRKETQGKDGDVTVETRVTEYRRVNTSLLRLMSDVSDKLAQMAGVSAHDPEGARPSLPVELHIHEQPTDSSGDSAPN